MDGLVWTDECSFKKELVAKGKSLSGPISIDCWEEKDYLIGIPRSFAATKNLFPDFTSFPEVIWPNLKVSYRLGQEEAVKGIMSGLLSKQGGITELHTGFGKTLIALNIAALLGTRVLVLAHKEDLLGQFEESARNFYGVDCGWVQQSKLDYLDKLVTVGTIQTISRRIDSIPKDFWNYFGLVVADEGHRVPSATFCEIFKYLTAKYRLGMSATFRRFDGLDDLWKWHIGDLLYSNNYKGLPGKYLQWRVKIPNREPKFTFNGDLCVSKLISSYSSVDSFNDLIARTAEFLIKQNRQVLIVSDRTEQLLSLSNRLPKDSFGFYVGSLPTETGKRSIGKKKLEEAKSKQVILATYLKVGEGSDIPSLDTIILASPRKDIEQVVGRIRRIKEGKKEPLVVDFVLPGSYNYALSVLRKNMLEDIGFSQIFSLKGP